MCILYRFQCEMDFSHHKSANLEVRKSHILCRKQNKMHFLTYLYFMLRKNAKYLYTNCEDDENQVRWIYLTTGTVLNRWSLSLVHLVLKDTFARM